MPFREKLSGEHWEREEDFGRDKRGTKQPRQEAIGSRPGMTHIAMGCRLAITYQGKEMKMPKQI